MYTSPALSRPVALLAWLTAGIMLLPLLGLALGLFNPPVHPLMGAPASFWGLFSQTSTWWLLKNTLLLAVSVSVLAVGLGSYLAWLAMRCRYPWHNGLAFLGLMPLAMPSYILAATLRESLSAGSWLGQALQISFFTGFVPALLTLVIITTPFVQLLVSASLARISAAEEEAARSLGASSWQIYKRIILPHCRPSIAFAFLITMLYTISDFGAVSVLDYPVLTWRLYQAVDHQQLAQATLLGSALLGMTIPVLVLSRLLHGRVPAITQSSNPRSAGQHTLGRKAKMAAYSAHAFIIGLGVVLPVFILSTWVFNGWQQQLDFVAIVPALWDSLRIAVLAATFIVCLAFFPAWYVARRPQKLGRVVEHATYLSSALPGILLAFGLMLVALYLARSTRFDGLYAWLLGSGLLLILGYTLCFLAQAYAGVKTAILRLDPRHYASAKTLGASNRRWFFKVALPSLRPGLAAAYILVFLAILKELPVTLLLGGAMGLKTLSFRVFDRYQEAFLHDAGLAGLVLLCLSFAIVVMILRWRRHV